MMVKIRSTVSALERTLQASNYNTSILTENDFRIPFWGFTTAAKNQCPSLIMEYWMHVIEV